ncbi:MAG TPA: peptidoglycan DD-metalloendopeptidase family protein [Flavobacteriaceae bacterium]|nr:peptidoglycan DD-metalloendopeptidase family protein [Flavobacteriaceae bacterium]
MNKPLNITLSLLFIALNLLQTANAQSEKQRELEERRVALQREIAQINTLLFEKKSEKKSKLTVIEELNHKIKVRENLIKVTNQQANLLTREINNNQNKISELRDQLKILKDNYAKMIVKSYKSKNEQSRIMFLLSSSNFKQAYKRLEYLKQYTRYQKQQGQNIKQKTTELQALNTDLVRQKEDKNRLIAENRKTQKTLESELKQHEGLLASINKNMNSYTAQIKAKQRETARIDKEIDNIIKAAIAASNKASGNTSNTSGFALTAEAKVLAANFVANKGKLPWPVEKGVVMIGYGTQPHPVVKTTTINSNGVRIATEENAEVRAVFEGEVLQVQAIKGANLTIFIRHGNYITLYKNLSKVYVKKGDKVNTKQAIGQVFTNQSNNESILYFYVFKDSKTQNPAEWIYKM